MSKKTRSQAIAALEAVEAEWRATGTITGATAEKVSAVLVALRIEADKK
jgi:hypothetical protein